MKYDINPDESKPTATVVVDGIVVISGISWNSFTTITDSSSLFIKPNMLEEKKVKTMAIVAIEANPPISV